MSHKQARLIAAVRDAMEAKGVKAADLARACGCSASMISTAMSGKAQMRDERWKMCCEYLGIDYEGIISELPQKTKSRRRSCKETRTRKRMKCRKIPGKR